MTILFSPTATGVFVGTNVGAGAGVLVGIGVLVAVSVGVHVGVEVGTGASVLIGTNVGTGAGVSVEDTVVGKPDNVKAVQPKDKTNETTNKKTISFFISPPLFLV